MFKNLSVKMKDETKAHSIETKAMRGWTPLFEKPAAVFIEGLKPANDSAIAAQLMRMELTLQHKAKEVDNAKWMRLQADEARAKAEQIGAIFALAHLEDAL